MPTITETTRYTSTAQDLTALAIRLGVGQLVERYPNGTVLPGKDWAIRGDCYVLDGRMVLGTSGEESGDSLRNMA